jgi:hypothetical protein
MKVECPHFRLPCTFKHDHAPPECTSLRFLEILTRALLPHVAPLLRSIGFADAIHLDWTSLFPPLLCGLLLLPLQLQLHQVGRVAGDGRTP